MTKSATLFFDLVLSKANGFSRTKREGGIRAILNWPYLACKLKTEMGTENWVFLHGEAVARGQWCFGD